MRTSAIATPSTATRETAVALRMFEVGTGKLRPAYCRTYREQEQNDYPTHSRSRKWSSSMQRLPIINFLGLRRSYGNFEKRRGCNRDEWGIERLRCRRRRSIGAGNPKGLARIEVRMRLSY